MAPSVPVGVHRICIPPDGRVWAAARSTRFTLSGTPASTVRSSPL